MPWKEQAPDGTAAAGWCEFSVLLTLERPAWLSTGFVLLSAVRGEKQLGSIYTQCLGFRGWSGHSRAEMEEKSSVITAVLAHSPSVGHPLNPCKVGGDVPIFRMRKWKPRRARGCLFTSVSRTPELAALQCCVRLS